MSKQINIKPRNRAGTWATFCRRYEPVAQEDGSVLRDWDDPAVRRVSENHVWTVVDCDGRCYVVPGFATVNYLGRILTARPWPDVEFSLPGYVY